LKKDEASINELFVRAHYIRTVQMAIRNRGEGIREIAINPMAFIEKEYQLKDGWELLPVTQALQNSGR
jgi:hypothetical protein